MWYAIDNHNYLCHISDTKNLKVKLLVWIFRFEL